VLSLNIVIRDGKRYPWISYLGTQNVSAGYRSCGWTALSMAIIVWDGKSYLWISYLVMESVIF